MTRYAAIDLGASSGRVIEGTLEKPENGSAGDLKFSLREVARFKNGAVHVPHKNGHHLHWDLIHLWDQILTGLARCEAIASIGVDTWAVDYGLLGPDGALIGLPYAYRDERTEGVPEEFFTRMPARQLYAANGLQVQNFNTMFQLLAHLAEHPEHFHQANQLLLLPDLLSCWLGGALVAEITNASSTGLVDPATREYSRAVLAGLGEAGTGVGKLLPQIVEPGTVTGTFRETLPVKFDKPPNIVAVGSHDTASAVLSVPAETRNFAYISCGTWSLVGLELDAPVRTEAARLANFTNELGVDNTVRFLKNIMGLWVFNECMCEWENGGMRISLAELDPQTAATEPFRTLVDVNDPVFYAPGPMTERIATWARQTGQPVPETPAQFSRCITESLAIAYANAIQEASRLAGHPVDVIHMVGGGINNKLLCQLTADATGLPVVAGPTEGTALGNLLMQARANGDAPGDIWDLRRIIRNSIDTITYTPQNNAAWAEPKRRIAQQG